MKFVNPQGDGLFLVLKMQDGVMDTGSSTGNYRHRPAARTYNTMAMAKTQATRFRNDGWEARIAEVRVVDGEPVIAWVNPERRIG